MVEHYSAGRTVEEQRVHRRLAAILAADVAGYSRLIGDDEEGTIARLRALRRELIDPAIAAHRGRIVKTTGDGILIEFPSVVDAVRCAVEVQREMTAKDANRHQDKRIAFRVGIHIGDVVVEGDDLLGDGVNVAARLEGILGGGKCTDLPQDGADQRCRAAGVGLAEAERDILAKRFDQLGY
jgi:adenylate cyclase